MLEYMIIGVAILFAGCEDQYVSKIPDYQVNLQLNLTSTYSIFKNSTNEYLLFETRILETDRIGYGGILVCTAPYLDDSGNSIYYAYDMCCPYEADKNIKVYPVEDDIGKVQCEECGSIFDVGFGSGFPQSGPAAEKGYVLKQYKTTLSGDYLYIYR